LIPIGQAIRTASNREKSPSPFHFTPPVQAARHSDQKTQDSQFLFGAALSFFPGIGIMERSFEFARASREELCQYT
jgi:hypothetical protein